MPDLADPVSLDIMLNTHTFLNSPGNLFVVWKFNLPFMLVPDLVAFVCMSFCVHIHLDELDLRLCSVPTQEGGKQSQLSEPLTSLVLVFAVHMRRHVLWMTEEDREQSLFLSWIRKGTDLVPAPLSGHDLWDAVHR